MEALRVMGSAIHLGWQDIVIVVVMACTSIVVVLSQMVIFSSSLVRIERHGRRHLDVLFFLRYATKVTEVFFFVTVVVVTAIFATFALLARYIDSDVGLDAEDDKRCQ